MARKAAKKNLVNEYSTIFVGDKIVSVNDKPVSSPIFVKVLKRSLVKLGGFAKFESYLRAEPYKTASGLQHKYFRSEGVLWVTETGKKGDNTYSNTTPVEAFFGDNKLTLTLKAKVPKNVGGTIKQAHDTVTILLPASMNAEQVGAFVKSKLRDKIIAWKYGKVTENLSGLTKEKSTRKTVKKDKNVDVGLPFYMPVGVQVNGRLTKTGSQSKAIADTKNTVVYGVVYESSALVMGFKGTEESTEKDIKNGTKTGSGGSQGAGKYVNFQAFKTPKVYSQIWSNVSTKNDETKTPIAVSGTGLKVKLRYTSNKVTAIAGAKFDKKINSENTYAYFSVPAGTCLGLIMDFVMNLPIRPRSFQLGSGSQFGNSYTVPSKSGSTRK